VTGRLDAFQWQTPLAALPSDKSVTVEASPFEEAMLASPRQVPTGSLPPREPPPAPVATVAPAAAQDNSPTPAAVEATPPPVFRPRQDAARNSASTVPPVIPIVRAPDDPGIDDEPPSDEFAEPAEPVQRQAGGWRGFLSRLGG
jgi:HemY protein